MTTIRMLQLLWATASPSSGPVPLTVSFSSAGSFAPDPGETITFPWDFQSDGVIDSTAPNTTYAYTVAGNYIARLTVTDNQGNTGIATEAITAGNTRPVVTIEVPVAGGFYSYSEANINSVSYRVASAGLAGNIEIHLDSVNGPLLRSAVIQPTGGWQTYTYVTVPITDPGRIHPVFLFSYVVPGIPAYSTLIGSISMGQAFQ